MRPIRQKINEQGAKTKSSSSVGARGTRALLIWHTRHACASRRLRTIIFFGLLTSVFGLSSCKEEKLDMAPDNRQVLDARANSNIRIVNLSQINQVIANGDSLTNFVALNPNSQDNYEYPPTHFFPEDGRLGKLWQVPQELLRADGTAILNFQTALYNQSGPEDTPDFEIQEEYERPKDYYLVYKFPTVDDPSTDPAPVEIPRSVDAPSSPDYFKVRIVNLASAYSSTGVGSENLLGSYSLTYADGTKVDEKTNQIQPGTWSDYVELPYGTYQFKVLTEDDRQVPGIGMNFGETTNVIDPLTSAIAPGYRESSYLTFAPIRQYQPGGIYTIVVSPVSFSYYTSATSLTSPFFQNGFDIITDSEPANTTYARIQGVNALPDVGEPIHFSIQGQELGSVGYGNASEYVNLIQGHYTVEALDNSGQVLATTEADLSAGFNYSAWLYPSAEGLPAIALVANNLSGNSYYPGGDDNAEFDYRQQAFPLNVRFLNFCQDESYITFTGDIGSPLASVYFNDGARQNLQPGNVPTESPYFNLGTPVVNPFRLLVFRSSPGVLPGTWAEDIPSISGMDFIADPDLYSIRDHGPNYEPGVYTVALIGSSRPGVPKGQNAKMIIVKHTK